MPIPIWTAFGLFHEFDSGLKVPLGGGIIAFQISDDAKATKVKWFGKVGQRTFFCLGYGCARFQRIALVSCITVGQIDPSRGSRFGGNGCEIKFYRFVILFGRGGKVRP